MFHSLKAKMAAVMASIVMIGFIAFVSTVSFTHKHETEDAKMKIKHQVEMAYGVLAYYSNQANTGKMTTESAQQAARDTIRLMRSSGGGYFWINDMQGVLLMHPVNPENEGLNRIDFKDKNGKTYYKDFIAIAKSNDREGWVDYVGPKPGVLKVEDRVSKISFVKAFQPWGWIIGTGAYVEDINTEMNSLANVYGWFFAISLLMMSAFIMMILGDIRGVILSATKDLKNITKGDYDISNTDRKDELGELTREMERVATMFKEKKFGITPQKRAGSGESFFDSDFFTKP